jgi:DNA-binding NtrC family response regulator
MPANRNIMVIDDDIDILKIIKRFLERMGLGVETFTNPLFALKAFESSSHDYSLVLVDIRMKEIDGISLAVRMREIKPDVKVVITTAFELIEEALTAKLPDVGCSDILKKPFTQAQICKTVKKQLQLA